MTKKKIEIRYKLRHIMKIQLVDLSGTIVGGDLEGKVQEIVTAATADPSLSGQQLWRSLVYSGASLGVDETQKYFTGQVGGTVQLLRELVSRLEVAQSMTDDETALNSMQAIQEFVHHTLKERASALVSMHAQQAAELYGIDADMIAGDLDPEQQPRNMVIAAGHMAYRRAPQYFVAWSMGTRSGEITKLKCKCSQCILSCLAPGVSNEGDEMSMAMVYFGGLDCTFAAYGIFLLTEFREALYREMSGLDSTHDSAQGSTSGTASGSAEDQAKGFMKHLMDLKPKAGTPPTKPPPENG